MISLLKPPFYNDFHFHFIYLFISNLLVIKNYYSQLFCMSTRSGFESLDFNCSPATTGKSRTWRRLLQMPIETPSSLTVDDHHHQLSGLMASPLASVEGVPKTFSTGNWFGEGGSLSHLWFNPARWISRFMWYIYGRL